MGGGSRHSSSSSSSTPSVSSERAARDRSFVRLRGFSESYKEHWQKAVRAVGDPDEVHNVNGWIGDLRSFAEQYREEALDYINNGGRLTSAGDSSDVWDTDRVESLFDRWAENILHLQQTNVEVAKKHNIPLNDY